MQSPNSVVDVYRGRALIRLERSLPPRGIVQIRHCVPNKLPVLMDTYLQRPVTRHPDLASSTTAEYDRLRTQIAEAVLSSRDRLPAGVVTLSQIERNLPTTANVDARDFKHLACWLIVQIGPISLNVTTPLVSHWPVVTSAAVELTTQTLERLRTDDKISKAEALRQSMEKLYTSKANRYATALGRDKAHPTYWAPFVIVGDGR